ncbi:glycosyltransferase [Algibacter sp. AS12]|uniref:glycosyltransferase n=1 Tax=Algibacter sp. AS12 TaxID=3135773 RepID=UPI00398A6433
MLTIALKFTIIYAFRNREPNRVRLSLLSLKNQTVRNFEVVFIDYGSTSDYSERVKQVVESFEFATYYYIGHEGLLWNKSKALNYGISKAKTEAIFIADVDVIVAPNFAEIIETLTSPNQFSLFKIGYLPESTSPEIIENSNFKALQPKHYGDTFGVGLFTKTALENVGGLDEFFHFYGSEDEDLNYRLIASGCKLNRCELNLLLHQWHERYPQKLKEHLTTLPRLSNIQRINQRHFLRHKEKQEFELKDLHNRKYYNISDYETLKKPSKVIEIENIESHVTHFLNYELPLFSAKVLKIVFKESQYSTSSKHKLKKALNKQTQPYLTMKQVNDFILQKILFSYRNYNYSFRVAENLKTIEFTIELRQ